MQTQHQLQTSTSRRCFGVELDANIIRNPTDKKLREINTEVTVKRVGTRQEYDDRRGSLEALLRLLDQKNVEGAVMREQVFECLMVV